MFQALMVAAGRQYCPHTSAQDIHEPRQFVEREYPQKHLGPVTL
jgi:hypothetical protein